MNVKGFTPHPDQRRVINQIEGDVKYVILTTGRQWGKTLLGINMLLKWSLQTSNSMNMWCSPVYSQCKKVFEQMTKAIAGTPVVQSINKSNLEIHFTNGSKVIFRSAEREDTMRGYTLDYLVIDEAAFIRDDVWSQVLRQTVLVKGKKVLFISTPRGKNFLYGLHLKGLAGDENYLSLQGTSYDTPYISVNEIEEAKNSLPADIFRQEIMAEFIDTGGEVFTDIDKYCVLENWQEPFNSKYFCGIDFGRQNDYTVLTIFDENGNLVYLYRERQKSWGDIIDDIVRILHKYNPQVQCEVNSIGDVLYEQLKKKYPRVQPFQTTSASKQNIIEDLLYALNEGQLRLASKNLCPELSVELKSFTYEYSPRTRQIKYGALSGAHDDIIMSLSIAFNTYKSRATKGQYFIYSSKK